MRRRARLAADLEAMLARHWWQPAPTWLARMLQPIALLYGWLSRRRQARALTPQRAPVPLLVVGNLIVGGAGKTPTVIALAQAFRAAGRHPGVISRGHGRAGAELRAVAAGDDPRRVGDEPLLIQRRTGVPVWVGRDRVAAARGLCAAHPEVDVLLSDDGLQHHALARDAELLVFDERGVGNGLLLPAGPLRQAVPLRLRPHQRVLYTDGLASTPLAGALAQRRIAQAWPLAAWQRADRSTAVALESLRGRSLLAVAGLASPNKFFAMLEAAGLRVQPLALPDHHAYATLPWPAGTAEVLTTEKDAVKLDATQLEATRVWVLPLDLARPAALDDDLRALLIAVPAATPP